MSRIEFEEAREELRKSAELLSALVALDRSEDLTRDAKRTARQLLSSAAAEFVRAAQVHRGNADEERRRAQAQMLEASPMAPDDGLQPSDDASAT